jgi:hypothetical protein
VGRGVLDYCQTTLRVCTVEDSCAEAMGKGVLDYYFTVLNQGGNSTEIGKSSIVSINYNKDTHTWRHPNTPVCIALTQYLYPRIWNSPSKPSSKATTNHGIQCSFPLPECHNHQWKVWWENYSPFTAGPNLLNTVVTNSMEQPHIQLHQLEIIPTPRQKLNANHQTHLLKFVDEWLPIQ